MFGKKKEVKNPNEQPVDEITKLQGEAQKLQAEAKKLYDKKIAKASHEIEQILNREGLTLTIEHIVKIVPRK